MRVTLTMAGGHFAGAGSVGPTIDSGVLAEPNRVELERLVGRALAAANRESVAAAGDAMTYRITIEDGEHAGVIMATDTAMPDEVADLLDWLARNAPQ